MSNRRDFIQRYRNSLDDKGRAEMSEMQMRTGMTDDSPFLAAIVETEIRMARIDKAEKRMMACAQKFAQAAEKVAQVAELISTEKPAHGVAQADEPDHGFVTENSDGSDHEAEVVQMMKKIDTLTTLIEQEISRRQQAKQPSFLSRFFLRKDPSDV